MVDRREGWDALAGGGLDVGSPRNHLTVMSEPLVAGTARAIDRALRDAAHAGRPAGPDAIRTGR